MKNIELHLGLPNFGGLLHAPFVRSLLNCQQNGKPRFAQVTFIDGDSLISRARNNCVENFLASAQTHLIFIDTDIEFNPEHIDKLVNHLQNGHQIVCGLYPKKQDKLEWVINGLDEMGEIDINKLDDPLIEIKYAGTGFLAISRQVLLDMQSKHFESYAYHTDQGMGQRRLQMDFFPVGVFEYPDGKRRYLSEDWYFCELARQCGHKIMCDTSIRTKHIGKKVYGEN